MKTKLILIATAPFAVLSGCSNTVEGVKTDAEQAGQKSAEAAQNMSSGAAEGTKNMGAATMLTPKIKLAITADKMLNDSKNLIDVDSTAEKVSLNGHVISAEQKTLAGEIAMKVLKENNATQKFVNNLDVTP